jgi:uncharacterized protein YndB with AHSA1/START domain
MSEPTRSHETRIEIDASVEEVWRSLTEPEALARWFAPTMAVTPGAGGSVLADWGPGLVWKTLIEVWEPNRHLRLTETRDRVMTSSPIEEPLPACRLVEDFYLESDRGRTVLRLVHSGFGTSAEWDGEFEGTRGGWAICFLRLKHGLERHRGEAVRNFILTMLCPGRARDQVLGSVDEATPPAWERVLRNDSHLCCVMPDHNGSILTVSVQPSPDGSVAYAEFLLFDQSASATAAIEEAWQARLRALRD